nr:MAG TPA: holin family protein [Caudoviricetes sp.]
MSIIFTIFGILSFVMFAYAIYAQNKQIEQLKKLTRYQRKTIARLSTLLPQDASDVQQNLDESWNEIKKILDPDITKN